MSVSADRQAALAEIKAYVRRVASSVDFEAFHLMGLPEDELDATVTEMGRLLAGNLAHRGTHVQRGLSFAFMEVIRERVAEFEAGRGRAFESSPVGGQNGRCGI